MSNEKTEQEKYLANLEALFMITMYKLGNRVEITDEELQSISGDSTLDVVTTETGLLLQIVKDV